jgi:diguanylate cyclase (GGDEF)-like protein
MMVKVVAELNRTVALQNGFVLELVSWETHSWPGVGEDAQDVINKQIGSVDIFVGMLWKRFGTPTKRAASGTAEEFEIAYEEWRKCGRPRILFYFCNRRFLQEDIPEFVRVMEFQNRLKEQGVYWAKFEGPANFADKVREHLTKELIELKKGFKPPTLKVPEKKVKREAKPRRPLATSEVLREDIVALARGRRPFALIYLDLDSFTAINQILGSAGADSSLDVITELITNLIPSGGRICSLSQSDALIALIPNCDKAQAEELSEQMRTSVLMADFEHGVQITASIGVSHHSGIYEVDVDQLVNEVRDACLLSKLNGRNRVSVAPLSEQDKSKVDELKSDRRLSPP